MDEIEFALLPSYEAICISVLFFLLGYFSLFLSIFIILPFSLSLSPSSLLHNVFLSFNLFFFFFSVFFLLLCFGVYYLAESPYSIISSFFCLTSSSPSLYKYVLAIDDSVCSVLRSSFRFVHFFPLLFLFIFSSLRFSSSDILKVAFFSF